MSFEYLPIMAQAGAPRPPRVLISPSKQAWSPLTKPVNASTIALLSSAALRLEDQQPFVPREDLSYRRIPADPAAGTIIIDHHSGISRVPKKDPEIVFPRTALASLAQHGIIGAISPFHFSFMGGIRRSREIEDELAPAIAADLKEIAVDLALLVPY
jgi:D-proline reductase (dithiol) PrdB